MKFPCLLVFAASAFVASTKSVQAMMGERIALARVFSLSDAGKLSDSFREWDVHSSSICSEPKSHSVDLFLIFSGSLDQSKEAISATKEVRSIFEETKGWGGCIDGFIEADCKINPSHDVFYPEEVSTNPLWVNGPNRRFERTVRIIQQSKGEEYQLMVYMTTNNVHVWNSLHLKVHERERHPKPFLMITSCDWEIASNFHVTPSHLYGVQQMAVYNISNSQFDEIIGKLELESWTDYNSIPFAFRISQIVQEIDSRAESLSSISFDDSIVCVKVENFEGLLGEPIKHRNYLERQSTEEKINQLSQQAVEVTPSLSDQLSSAQGANKRNYRRLNGFDHVVLPFEPTKKSVRYCENDESFRLNNRRRKDCNWVAKANTWRRCKKEDRGTKILVEEFCPVVCDPSCNSETPTESPSESHSDFPSSMPSESQRSDGPSDIPSNGQTTIQKSANPSQFERFVPSASPTETFSLTPSLHESQAPTLSLSPSNNLSPLPSASFFPTEIQVRSPTGVPTKVFSLAPTTSTFPSRSPSFTPTKSRLPSEAPTTDPSDVPTEVFSLAPTTSTFPSESPSITPTKSFLPTEIPTVFPTDAPIEVSSLAPTISMYPSEAPSFTPTRSSYPSDVPTGSPSQSPIEVSSLAPTISMYPSEAPSFTPTRSSYPSDVPTGSPSQSPIEVSSLAPTISMYPSEAPSFTPTRSSYPSDVPTGSPSQSPIEVSSLAPTISMYPSEAPSFTPTRSSYPSDVPTGSPSQSPIEVSSLVPTISTYPSEAPGVTPTRSFNPSEVPTEGLSLDPAVSNPPSKASSEHPTETHTPKPSPIDFLSFVPSVAWNPTERSSASPSESVYPTNAPFDTSSYTPTKDCSKHPLTDQPTKSAPPNGIPIGFERPLGHVGNSADWTIGLVILGGFFVLVGLILIVVGSHRPNHHLLSSTSLLRSDGSHVSLSRVLDGEPLGLRNNSSLNLEFDEMSDGSFESIDLNQGRFEESSDGFEYVTV